MTTTTTPNELARELGISPKTLRAWLREQFPREECLKWTDWEVTPEMAEVARRKWFGEDG